MGGNAARPRRGRGGHDPRTGGTIALWAFHVRARFSIAPIVVWAGLFATFALGVWLAG
jgi:hypothetical protein